MNAKNTNDIIEVYAGSPLDTGLIMSMLQDSDIECFLQDENMGTIAPWQVSAGGAGAVKIMINSNDLEKARLIIEQFEQNRK